ncbi:uncharacterized protein [Labrus bergylta]|uniref:uncharacterized protein isoform X2 n=1 Tax=Labrus bergylta TaxID=56723 RepID=UPI0033135B51
MLLLGILMLLLTVTGEDVLSFTVRVGDDVTLPCGRVTEDQPNCDQITWLFNRDIGEAAVELVTNGDLSKNAEAKAERLNVSEDCSLVIKNVTPQDVGRYTCRQFRSGEQHGPDAEVSLSVIDVESHGPVFFICSVLTYSGCWHSVEWLYKGHMKDTETTQHTCSADVSLPSPLPDQKSNLDESLYCKVTDVRSGQTLRLNVTHQSSHEETGKGGTSSEGKERTKEEPPTNPAVTGEDVPSFTVRVGDDVTLPCGRVTEDQPNCDQISWLFNRDIGKAAVELVTNGDLSKNAKAEAERLNVSEDCSLVIKNVTPQDVGLYTCRQFRSGEQHGPDAKVSLSVIDVESHGPVFFICSVLTYSGCWHSVEWLYKGHMKDTDTTQRTCSADVSLPSPLPDQKSNLDESLYCKVTDVRSGQTLRLNVTHQSSHEETVWWPFAGLAAVLILLVIIAAFIRRKKSKGSRTQRDENIEDPEEGVAYASVIFTKNCNSKVKADDDDEGEAVTYSTVRVSSPDAEASVDPSGIYATINKPNNRETNG